MDEAWLEKAVESLGVMVRSLEQARHPLAPKVRKHYGEIKSAIEADGDIRLCDNCQAPLPPPAAVGRPRRFCSKRCGQRYHQRAYARRRLGA